MLLLRYCFWLYLLALVYGDATHANPADPDLWHRLALGEYLWNTHHFPTGGTFSYLADFRLVADHEWGGALIFYAACALGGSAAIVAIKIVSLAATLVLLVLAGTQGRRPTLLLAAFYALVLLALLPSFQSTIRCGIFTHIFLALLLYWFQLERHGRSIPLWAYALTMVLWANLHGGFVLGLVWLLGVAIVLRDEREKWAMRFIVCGLVTFINPFGWNLWVSTVRALLITRTGFDEWHAVSWWPDLFGFPGYKLMVVLTLLVFFWIGYRKPAGPKYRNAMIYLLTGAFILSLLSARHTSIFAAVAGALLPDLFPPEPRVDTMPRDIPRLGYLAFRFALILLPFFSVFLLPGDGLTLRYPPNSCPVAAVDFLEQQNLRGNLLVPFNYGSYALWRLRGRMRVSMDGRYDLVYLPQTFRRVDDFFSARGDWTDLLRASPPTAILLPVTAPVFAKLKTSNDWSEAWHDPLNAVFLPR